MAQLSSQHIFFCFLQLGLTAFGGPIAHIAYFRDAFVAKRRWLTESQFTELVAMSQLLPGPTSSQVGFALGYHAGGYRGALAAWLGFTLPSALLLTMAALGVLAFNGLNAGLLQGLLAVTVAVVAHAIWTMFKQHSASGGKLIVMLLAAATLCLFSSAQATISVLLCAGVIGAISFRKTPSDELHARPLHTPSFRSGVLLLSMAFALLFVLPLLSMQSPWWALVDGVYRAGALVFGGGHVVLPLLQAELVTPGWLSANDFYAGYGLAQAVPGPLFTVAAYLGASAPALNAPILGAALLLITLFLPGLLLVIGLLPFWAHWQQHISARAAIVGLNAAVVGLLLATWLVHIVPHAWSDWRGIALSLIASVALIWMKWPAWLVVIVTAAAGFTLGHTT